MLDGMIHVHFLKSIQENEDVLITHFSFNSFLIIIIVVIIVFFVCLDDE